MTGAGLKGLAMAGAAMMAFGVAGAANGATYFTHNFSIVSVGGEGPPGESFYSPPSTTPITTSSDLQHDALGVTVNSVTSTTALTGAVKSSALASAYSSGAVCCTFAAGSSRAYGWAEYQDTMILTAPNILPGTAGRISASALISGAAAADWSAASISLSWRTTVFVNGQAASRGYLAVGTASSPTLFVLEDSGFGLQPLAFDVLFGVPMAVSLRVETGVEPTVGLAIPGFASGESNLGSTLTWNGISGVTAGGVAVTDFSALSPTSGFDFRRGYQPTVDPDPGSVIPEPETWAMMIVGFGLVGGLARRRPVSAPA